jgi:hypothetical protein
MDQEPRALIKRHNEYVREQVVHDLEALEEKLNVKRHASEKAHAVVDKAKGTLGMSKDTEVHGVGDFARKNAVPLAAVGLGGALLARNAKQVLGHNGNGKPTSHTDMYAYETAHDEGTKDKLVSKASDVKDAATGKVSDAKLAVTDTASSVKDTVTGKAADMRHSVSDAGTLAAVRASELKDSVAERVPSMPSRAQAKQTVKENAPLFGLAALALGALAGAFIPRTRMEEERLAPVQESVLGKATDVVSEKVDMAKDAVQAGVETVKDGVKDGVDTVKDELSSSTEDDSTVTTPNRITGSTSSNGMSTPAGSL